MDEFIPTFDLPDVNTSVSLVRRPPGIPLADDFAIVAAPLTRLAPEHARIRNLYLSVDPVQRGWAADPDLIPLGGTMRSLAVGLVVESRLSRFAEGDIVYGYFGWQTYHDAQAGDVLTHVRKPVACPSLYAGVLGMPGITAYLALADLAPPGPGKLILVSTAAGAVGSVVGQLAQHAGATTVGLTGDDEKCARCVADYGYHHAINYKSAALDSALADVAGSGFDIYFDNTGGAITDIAVRRMALYGRIVQCGTAATASWVPAPTGLRNEREILMRRLSWNGFVIFDHLARFDATVATLESMVLTGALHHDEDFVEGLGQAPHALSRVFAGANRGKTLISLV